MTTSTSAWTAYGFAWELNEERWDYISKMVPSFEQTDDQDKALTGFVQELLDDYPAQGKIAASISGNNMTGELWLVVSVKGTAGEGYDRPVAFVSYADEPIREDLEALAAVARFIGYSGRTGRMFGQDVY